MYQRPRFPLNNDIMQCSKNYNQVFCYSCLPAVQMSQEECGAQAIPFTQALWLLSLATGVQGTRTSKITT